MTLLYIVLGLIWTWLCYNLGKNRGFTKGYASGKKEGYIRGRVDGSCAMSLEVNQAKQSADLGIAKSTKKVSKKKK